VLSQPAQALPSQQAAGVPRAASPGERLLDTRLSGVDDLSPPAAGHSAQAPLPLQAAGVPCAHVLPHVERLLSTELSKCDGVSAPRCRPSQRKHYPPSRRLVFHVLRGMPRLALTLEGLPAEAAAGELLRVQVWFGCMICDNERLVAVCPGWANSSGSSRGAAAAAGVQ
jgi:hypothetical protein